jgi:AcrR family transcriptional regulator
MASQRRARRSAPPRGDRRDSGPLAGKPSGAYPKGTYPEGTRRQAGPRAAQAYDGVQRERLGDLQRARIISAMFDVATQRGAGGVSVAHVVERSGVSRRTFYELFSDREDCFLAAFEEAVSYASERVLPAYRSESGWRERIRAGLVALLSFLDEEPVIGRLLICESLGGRPKTLERRGRVLAEIRRAIEEGAKQAKAGFTPPPLTGEGIVGGVLAVIQGRLSETGRTRLAELTNPLMSMIVLPYLGPAAARRELERPIPAPTPRNEHGSALLSDPFKDAGMRLTYRTVRVLMAVADHPQASNRTIGDTAEIKDQGQISKLLARLQRGGLVSNTGLGPGQGAPNAWTLTSSGRQVTESIRTHTEGPNHRRVT